MKHIKLYHSEYKSGDQPFLEIPVDDDSVRYKEIMGDNSLTLKFSLNEFINIPIGTWCDYTQFKSGSNANIGDGEIYRLFTPDNFTKQHSEHYDYTLVMESSQAYLKFVKFKFFTLEKNPGQEDKIIGAPKMKFSLTAKPKDFAELLVNNMNISGDKGWTVGDMVEDEPTTLDFNHDDCFTVLQKIAEAFNTEWEVENKTIHVRKVERISKDSGQKISFALSYGYKNGILPGLSRKQFDNSKVINRVWIQGGDRNINREDYKNDTLLMSREDRHRIVSYDGVHFSDEEGKMLNPEETITYLVDVTGSYVERIDRTGVVSEDSLDVSKIYPAHTGRVTSVTRHDEESRIFEFEDSTNTIDYASITIPSEKKTIIFQTGQLAGKELDLDYYPNTKTFRVIQSSENGLDYPSRNITFKGDDKGKEDGDTYAIFHITPDVKMLEEAEIKARNEAIKYLYENSMPKYTYQWQLDGIYAKDNWESIGGYLDCGYFVKFSDASFLEKPVDVRITSVKEYVNNPTSPTIEISNNVSGTSLGSIINQIPTQEQAVDRKDKESMGYSKRRWRDTQELIDNIYGITAEFENNLLSSLVFEGLVFRAGAPSLQYKFYEDDWNTVIDPIIIFNDDKKIEIGESRIIHEEIKIDNKEARWLVKPYISDSLVSDLPYYLYIEAKIKPTIEDGIRTWNANFRVSHNKIKLEDKEGHYTFWVAFINSEDDAGKRSIRTMYGFTELLPGQVTADALISSDGASFLKLLGSQLMIKGKNNSIDWNVTGNQLSIKDGDFKIGQDKGGDYDITASIDNETGAAVFGRNTTKFNVDGSGMLAGGNIDWDKDGITKISDFEINKNIIKLNSENTELRLGTNAYNNQIANSLYINNNDVAQAKKAITIINSSNPKLPDPNDPMPNIALHIQNGGLKINPNNIIDMPGVLLGGRYFGAKNTTNNGNVYNINEWYKWGRGGRGNLDPTIPFTVKMTGKDNKDYEIVHNLGHTNYIVNITPVGFDDWRKYHVIISDISQNSFVFVFADSGSENTMVYSNFCFSVIGNNTTY